jgi:hypothetical protein
MAPIRIVTSCYNDDINLSWTLYLIKKDLPYVIYKKTAINENLNQQFDDLSHQLIQIPNICRCEYAFIYHIVNNYDRLDDVTVFVKSNWQKYGIRLYYLLENCKNYDYMTVGTHEETIGYLYHEQNDIDFWTNWYDNIFDAHIEKPKDVHSWGHGPCFSVSRELIRRHPKSTYEYLLDRLSRPTKIFSGSKLNEVGVMYHNEIQRFYTIFFTHGLVSNQYKICKDKQIDNIKTNIIYKKRRFSLFT